MRAVFLLFVFIICGHPVMAAFVEARAMNEGEGGTGTETVVVAAAKDNGKEIVLKIGAILQIELRTVGAAGYSWKFDKLDEDYLKVISHESEAVSGASGAPVRSVWRLKARKRGSLKIAMYNYRVWEGKEKSVNTFVLQVKIE